MNDELHQTIYERIFENMCQRIELQKEDASFTIEELENRLNSLYVFEGNDQEGRGQPKEIETSATIAAMEHMLAEWRAK